MELEHHKRPMPTERSFGLSVGFVALAAGGVALWRGYSFAGPLLAAIGAVLVVAGLIAPAVLRGPNRVWWAIAQVLGWINARILLSVFFFLVLTPVGVVMRLFGRSPLRPPQGGTNWVPCAARRRDPRHYERQF